MCGVGEGDEELLALARGEIELAGTAGRDIRGDDAVYFLTKRLNCDYGSRSMSVELFFFELASGWKRD